MFLKHFDYDYLVALLAFAIFVICVEKQTEIEIILRVFWISVTFDCRYFFPCSRLVAPSFDNQFSW